MMGTRKFAINMIPIKMSLDYTQLSMKIVMSLIPFPDDDYPRNSEISVVYNRTYTDNIVNRSQADYQVCFLTNPL